MPSIYLNYGGWQGNTLVRNSGSVLDTRKMNRTSGDIINFTMPKKNLFSNFLISKDLYFQIVR